MTRDQISKLREEYGEQDAPERAPLSWECRGLAFGEALQVWCAAAGIHNAYQPVELARLARRHYGWAECESLAELHELCEHASRCADWSPAARDLNGPSCAKAIVFDLGLVWFSSVWTVLERDSDVGRWYVRIYGQNADRAYAAGKELARLEREGRLKYDV